ncbi:hypothetical protein NRB56_44410 [Nocardia sp. RB56]|uniref:Mycothiol-dependent maleylpyruvate isomerase metal-binding domain-containing protein n=2 Tax=Nocardia aurantia TaxID=2585199 RepID=A0A7K0DT02_9NOCA|nr:hypothetical protein [Nocardia aurantia]
MITDERRDLIATLRTLSDEEWEAPSLCGGWRVRDVAAHLCSDAVSPWTFGNVLVRQRFSFDGLNDALVEQKRAWPVERVLELLESTVGRGVLSATIPGVILADSVVHHQDILRPLGRTRTVPADRLLFTLSHPDPFARPWRIIEGLRFVATDVPWSRGTGPEIRGPGEALALAMVGRPVVLGELEGDGVDRLRDRLS